MNSDWIFPHIVTDGYTIEDLIEKFYEEGGEFGEVAREFSSTEDKLDFLEKGMDVIHAVETIMHYFNITHREYSDAIDFVALKNKLSGAYGTDSRSNAEKNNAQNGVVTWVR